MVDFDFSICYIIVLMALFLTGEYRHQLDEKSRFRIPAKLRMSLGEEPMIMAGPDGSIIVMPYLDAVKEMDSAFGNINISSGSSTKAQLKESRVMASSAFRASEDAQGRIVLPATLIKHANVKKDIVTIGNIKRLEIWSVENWEKYLATEVDEVTQIVPL